MVLVGRYQHISLHGSMMTLVPGKKTTNIAFSDYFSQYKLTYNTDHLWNLCLTCASFGKKKKTNKKYNINNGVKILLPVKG